MAFCIPPARQFFPEFFQCCQQGGIVAAKAVWTDHHDHIETCEQILMMAKTFPDQAFQTIAVYRSSCLFLCDSKAQPGGGTGIGAGKNREIVV